MYALVVRFEVRPDCVQEFDELVARTVAEIKLHEPGTLAYMSMHVSGSQSARVFVEVYRDEIAFEDHENQPHTKVFLEAREPLLLSVRVEGLSEVVAKFPGMN